MKQEPKAFESYPLSTVLIANTVSLIVSAVGVYLLWQLNIILGLLFIVYLLGLEFSVYRQGCSCCYYYGKRCAFGRGKIAPFLVKKDDPQKFCQRKVTWKNLLPVILVSLIPLIAGIVLLVRDFNWLILILLFVPLANWFLISPLLYGKLVCLHCKQGRLCCPANDFFGKKKS